MASILILMSLGNASAAWKQFIPRYVDFSGIIGTSGLYEENKTSSQTKSTKRSELTIQEGIGFDGLGYIYSPLFVSMHTSLSLGLEQNRIRKDSFNQTKYSDANQFKQVFKFLPARPYNLEIYGSRSRPLQSGSWGGNSPVIYNYGAKALYEFRPWNISATYTEHDTRSETPSIDKSFIFSSGYFDDIMGISASVLYQHNTFKIQGSNGNMEKYGVNYSKKYESWSYKTRFHHDRQNEENDIIISAPQSHSFERQEWHNELKMAFPQNFSSLLSYTVAENDTTSNSGTNSEGTYTDTERYDLKLRHRLYKSLFTSVGYNHNYIESANGRSKQESYRLRADYSKKLRWGHFLNSSWGSHSEIDNIGALKKLFANYSISNLPTAAEPKPYSFTLNFQLINRDSITIYLLDNINPPIETRIILTENLHYIVEGTPGNLFRITILPFAVTDLGLGLSAPTGLLESYGYQADYAFIPSDYELRTQSWGNTIQLPLFDSLITPIYSYSETKQKEIAGNYPGIPEHSTSHTVALAFQKIPFRGEVSQNWFRSTTNSTDRLNASLDYTMDLSSYTSGIVTLSYEDASITEKLEEPPTEIDETLYSIQAQLQTLWPQQNLTGSIMGNYSIYNGTGDSRHLSFITSMLWRVGQLSFDLSASYSDSVSESGNDRTDQSHTLVRFNLTRELF